MDLESPTTWNNVTVPGNKTSTILPDLAPGKRYFVMVQAATKAGYGKPSDLIIIPGGGSNGRGTSVSTPSGNQKSPHNVKPDPRIGKKKVIHLIAFWTQAGLDLRDWVQFITNSLLNSDVCESLLTVLRSWLHTGIILGLSISLGFIAICVSSVLIRKKYENSRSLRNDVQPAKGHILSRNGNRCCTEQSSTSMCQQANATGASNEIELAVLCPTSSIETNPQPDSKVKRNILRICAINKFTLNFLLMIIILYFICL